VLSCEKAGLIVRHVHRSRAFLVIIRHVVDPRADRIAAHQPSFVRLQKLRDDLHVGHAGIEPQIVVVRIKNDGHSVVDGCPASSILSGQRQLDFPILFERYQQQSGLWEKWESCREPPAQPPLKESEA